MYNLTASKFEMKVFLMIMLGAAAILGNKFQVLATFTGGRTQFTAKVYKELAKSNARSFLVCTLSVDVLLALLHAGAKGKTAQQLSESLNLPSDRAIIDETFTNLSSQLKSTKDFDLISANKVYLNNGFQISDKFKSTAVNVFNTEIQNVHFQNNHEAANEINHWVEEKTHNKIKNLVSPKDLEGSWVVLINAVYFRGKWIKQFSSHATKKRFFHVNTTVEIEVEMMKITAKFNGYVNAKLKAKFLEMPYKGDDITMTFVLPDDVEGLSRLEANIADILVAPAYRHGRTNVVLPKFKMETNIQFKPILEAIGIREPFSSNADFTGFGANEGPLKISKIIEKTYIEVEEKGTTAAAGSRGNVVLFSKSLAVPPVLEFVADHPFIYYIKIKGIVVFVGRYAGR